MQVDDFRQLGYIVWVVSGLLPAMREIMPRRVLHLLLVCAFLMAAVGAAALFHDHSADHSAAHRGECQVCYWLSLLSIAIILAIVGIFLGFEPQWSPRPARRHIPVRRDPLGSVSSRGPPLR